MARGRLARSVGDAGMGELSRQIAYKGAWAGRHVIKIDCFEPTSRTCSACRQMQEMLLHRRMMRCACGLEMDRDVNAAVNIARIGARAVGGSPVRRQVCVTALWSLKVADLPTGLGR